MTIADAAILLAAGFGAGLVGYITGLASLVSYPALLAVGLSPVAANVTNTLALVAVGVGSTAKSGRSLIHHGRLLWWLIGAAAIGGTIGAILLLRLPHSVFGAVVPWLIVLASLALLCQPLVRRFSRSRAEVGGSVLRQPNPIPHPVAFVVVVGVISIYGGYFGAGAGVIMLATTLLMSTEPLWRATLLKSVVLGVANLVAAVYFALTGPVHWAAAVIMGVGCLIGGWLGPPVVRRLPEAPLRTAVAIAGFGLAAWLAFSPTS